MLEKKVIDISDIDMVAEVAEVDAVDVELDPWSCDIADCGMIVTFPRLIL